MFLNKIEFPNANSIAHSKCCLGKDQKYTACMSTIVCTDHSKQTKENQNLLQNY